MTRINMLLPPKVLTAEYRRAVVPDHVGNPLIEALPPPADLNDLMGAFGRHPPISAVEREHAPYIRVHEVSRLDMFLEALPMHFDVAIKIGPILRGGYVHRNPTDDAFRRWQRKLYRESLDGIVQPIMATVPPTAPAFALFGISGLGKSSTIERLLSFYPQALCHEKYGFVQVVWLKLDCPVGGGLKDLLLSLLAAIDALIGTEYRPRRRKEKAIAELILDAAIIADSHYLGVLVIDEIQNLLDAAGVGKDKLLKYFVMIANVFKIPFILIGTPRAIPFIQTTFHEANRASAYGSLTWEPLPRGDVWDFFLVALFAYQWTTGVAVVTEELSATLHYLTQGIVGLVVHLFQLTQIEAIRRNHESISADLLREVAAVQFRLVKPMLDVLRSGGDIKSKEYDDLLVQGLYDLETNVASAVRLTFLQEQARSRPQAAAERLLAVSSLVELGYDQAATCEIVDRIFDTRPDTSAASAVRQILEATQIPSADPSELGPSLKDIVMGARPGQTPEEALRSAGVITPAARSDRPRS
jgi:hypothetical protein